MISYWNYTGIGKPIQFTIGEYLSVEWDSTLPLQDGL